MATSTMSPTTTATLTLLLLAPARTLADGATATARVYYIRHGQSQWNAEQTAMRKSGLSDAAIKKIGDEERFVDSPLSARGRDRHRDRRPDSRDRDRHRADSPDGRRSRRGSASSPDGGSPTPSGRAGSVASRQSQSDGAIEGATPRDYDLRSDVDSRASKSSEPTPREPGKEPFDVENGQRPESSHPYHRNNL